MSKASNAAVAKTATKVVPNKTQKKEPLPVPAEVDKLETKSAKIRALDGMKWTRGDIARALGIRYQFVRNVLIQPVKSTK